MDSPPAVLALSSLEMSLLHVTQVNVVDLTVSRLTETFRTTAAPASRAHRATPAQSAGPACACRSRGRGAVWLSFMPCVIPCICFHVR